MYLAEEAEQFVAVVNICLTARMQKALATVRTVRLSSGDAKLVKELLDDTLHREEIAVSVHTERELYALIRQLGQRKCLRNVDVAQLIEADIFISVAVVEAKRGQHAVHRLGTHDTEVLTERIHDFDRATQRGICRNHQLIKCLRALEGVHHTL